MDFILNIRAIIALLTVWISFSGCLSANQIPVFIREHDNLIKGLQPQQSSISASISSDINTLPFTNNTYRGKCVLYVNGSNVSSTQDGKSWATAYKDLQDALAEAAFNFDVSQIRIACGVYKPSKTYTPLDANNLPVVAGAFSLPQFNPGITNDGVLLNYADDPNFFNNKLRTFQLIDGVDLIGGYVIKNNKECRTRNCECKTILDGNLGTKEQPDFVWHILTAGNDITHTGVTCRLTNLTLQNGDASAAPYFPLNYFLEPGQFPIYYHDDGAGLYVNCKSAICLERLEARNLKAIAGGAVYADDGSMLEFNQCIFSDNNAFDGAAVVIRSGGVHDLTDFNTRVSTATFSECQFTKNLGTSFGTIAAYDNYGINPDLRGPNLFLRRCQFHDVTPFGTICTISTNLQMTNTKIDNCGVSGGMGIFAAFPTFCRICASTIKNCHNTNVFPGGGISVFSPLISNNYIHISKCIFENNVTIGADGGALSLMSIDNPLHACIKGNVFKCNRSTERGGAIFINENVIASNNICKENKFENNAAPVGDDIFIEEGASVPQDWQTK